jgi:hypothetical protein
MMLHDALSLFEPEVLLPEQVFSARRADGLAPERLLMLAIVEDAILCYRRHAFARDPRARRLHADAVAWLESSDRTWLFSFESICDALDIDAGLLRASLRRWRERRATAGATFARESRPRVRPLALGAR